METPERPPMVAKHTVKIFPWAADNVREVCPALTVRSLGIISITGNGMESINLLEESNPHLVVEPKEVLRILQDLQKEQTFVTILLPHGQKVLTVLLEVDEKSGYFLYDIGRDHAETQALLSMRQLHFISALSGVTVRFTTPTPTETMFGGAPAFRSPFPADLQYLQRREHYRSKVILPAVCNGKLANGTAVSLQMSDLSLGGVRLRSGSITPDVLPVGTVLKDAVLDFMELGKVELTLTVASQQTTQYEGISTYSYGCHIEKLPRSKEAAVQKLVFSLELLNRPNRQSMMRG
jgi:c-di-GMP-binding flagellar brake protein YcgR